ncbi:MAG: RNA methyltransferase [Flavobacterium sp.]
MVIKNQLKLISQLHTKKFRNQHQLFLVEGVKSVHEFLEAGWDAVYLFTTKEQFLQKKLPFQLVTTQEMQKMSCFEQASEMLGVFKILAIKPMQLNGRIIALDQVRDPGNLGTIIRLCDWFGIETLLCSKDTVEVYNPKVIQATMGSLTRVQVHVVDLKEVLKSYSGKIYGTLLDGTNIYQTKLETEGIIVMGSESHGISDAIKAHIQEAITIPRFGSFQKAESLNVANATAIILSEWLKGN